MSRKALSDFGTVQKPLSGAFAVPKLYFKRTQLKVYASNTASHFTLLSTTKEIKLFLTRNTNFNINTESFFKIWGAWNIASSLPNHSCSLHFFQHNAKQFKTWWNHLSKQWWTLGFTQTITVLVLSNADSLSDLTVLRRQVLKWGVGL